MKLLLALCPLFASATPTIWPMPSSLVENGANLTVGASTFFVEKAAVAGSSSSSSSSALLTEAFTRYTSLTFPHGITFDDTDQIKVKDSKELTSLVVSVEELDESHPAFHGRDLHAQHQLFRCQANGPDGVRSAQGARDLFAARPL